MEISDVKLETRFIAWCEAIKKPRGNVLPFEAFKEGFRQGTLLLKDGEPVQGVRIIKVEKCADCPYCLLGADDIQFTCDEANVEDPTWYINRPIPDWCPLPEEEV